MSLFPRLNEWVSGSIIRLCKNKWRYNSTEGTTYRQVFFQSQRGGLKQKNKRIQE